MNKLVKWIIVILAVILIVLSVSMDILDKDSTEDIKEPETVFLAAQTMTPDDELLHTEPSNETVDTFWDSDIHWMAMALEKESGPNWTPWEIVMIGDVIMHRVWSDEFPDTVKEVLLAPGQYAPFMYDFKPFMPEKKYITIATAILEDGESYIADRRVVYQALFPQGDKTVFTIYDEDLGTTTYFCR